MPQGQGPEEKKALDGEGEGGYFRNFRGSRTGASGSQGCEVGVRRSRIGGHAVQRPGWAETGMEILELVLRLPRRMTAATPATPPGNGGVELPGSASPGSLGAPSPSGPLRPPAGPAGCGGARGRYSPGGLTAAGVAILLGRLGARRAGARSGDGAEPGAPRGRRGRRRPRRHRRRPSAAPPPPHKGRRGRALLRALPPPGRPRPRLCRLRPLPGLLLRPQPLSRGGGRPAAAPRAGPQHRETWGGGLPDPRVGGRPLGAAQVPRLGLEASPLPALRVRVSPRPPPPRGSRTQFGGALSLGPGAGPERVGGRPLRFRGKMERNKGAPVLPT